MKTVSRRGSFGQGYSPTLVDRFGVWLSAVQIRRGVPSFRGKRVGDFGCGFQAAFARSILADAAAVTVVDLALAPDLKAHSKVTAIEGALPETLPLIAAASLDVVLCVSVLEHLWEPLEALQEIHRILAPGGVCLINVPSWRGRRFLEFSAFVLHTSPEEEMNDHKSYYDVRDLWPLLVRAGFAPSAIRCYPHKFGLNTFAICQKS